MKTLLHHIRASASLAFLFTSAAFGQINGSGAFPHQVTAHALFGSVADDHSMADMPMMSTNASASDAGSAADSMAQLDRTFTDTTLAGSFGIAVHRTAGPSEATGQSNDYWTINIAQTSLLQFPLPMACRAQNKEPDFSLT